MYVRYVTGSFRLVKVILNKGEKGWVEGICDSYKVSFCLVHS